MTTITVSSKALFSKLRTISKIVKQSAMETAFRSFMLEIEGGKLQVTGCDDAGQMSTDIECEIINPEDMSFLVDASTILNALKELPDQPIKIQITKAEASYNIEILYYTGKYTMSGINADIFPRMGEYENTKSFTVESEMLRKGLSMYKFASTDDLRPIMMTVNLSCKKDSDLTFAGTSGHVLSIFEPTGHSIGEDINVNIPSKIAKMVTDIMHSDSDISIDYDERTIAFTVEDYYIRYRLFEGKFPNFRSVVPTYSQMDVKVNRYDLISALNRVAVFSNSDIGLIKFTLSNNNLILTAQDIDYNKSAKEDLFLDEVYDDFEIGFRSSLLLEILKNIETENCIVKLNEPSKAVLIVPEGVTDSTYLIMPMQINN